MDEEGILTQEQKLNDECDQLEKNIDDITKRIEVEYEILELSEKLKNRVVQNQQTFHQCVLDIEKSTRSINYLKHKKRYINAVMNEKLKDILALNTPIYHGFEANVVQTTDFI